MSPWNPEGSSFSAAVSSMYLDPIVSIAVRGAS